MMEKRRFLPIAAIAAVAFVAAACSSSDDAVDSGGPVMPPTPVVVDLDGVTDGTTAEDGTLEIEAGMSEDSGNTAFACAADGDDCTVTITVGDDGTVSATSTGGMVMAGNSADHQMAIDAAAAAAIELATSNAMTKTTALGVEAAQTTAADITGDGRSRWLGSH